MSDSNNRTIAKNTMALYARTIVVLFVSLYTSRLVLSALGETDLGIYNVVAGVVAIFSFLQASQTKATSRFITYELGKSRGEKELNSVFSDCMTIHIIIALLVIVLGETIGLYVISNWTSIPIERQTAAMIVYQVSLLTFCLQNIRIPYDSVIIAHERMSFFAYMSIIECGLQLVLVYCLQFINADKLILYSTIILFISIITLFLYSLYVRRHFPYYKARLQWTKGRSKQILSYSGWTLFGTGSNTVAQQGVSLLFNNFVGLVANAALGFANQVNGALQRFVNNFTTAFNPQIVKLYAQGSMDAMQILMRRASKFSFALAYIIGLPLIINMDYILDIWLIKVPQYTAEFCRMIVICTIIDAVSGVFYTAITATEEIKKYQLAISCSFLLDFVCSFVLLYLGVKPSLVFSSRIVTRGLINFIIGLFFCKKQLQFNVKCYFSDVIFKIILSLIIVTIPVLIVSFHFDRWILLLFSTLLSTILMLITSLFIIMDKNERLTVIGFVRSKIKS